MTKFNEIGQLHSSQRSCEVPSHQLMNYIGDQLVWQERYRLAKSYGTILSARTKGDYVIVEVSQTEFGEETTKKLSLTFDTKVVIRLY